MAKYDPDKELKACLDRLPYPKWNKAHKLINSTEGAPAKPTYLNFNALGAKMKIWCMNGEAKHVLKMATMFKSFNQDPVVFLDWEQLLTCTRRLVALDQVALLKELCVLFKANGQNARQLPPGARWSMLTFAAFLGRADIVDYLTGKEGCFPAKIIDEVDEQGCTALVWAAASGSVDAVRTLIDRNADINTVISTKESPLMIATCKGHAQVVRLLIDREADVNMVDVNADRHGSGWGPVQKACWWGHDNVLGELLLEHKHNPALEKTLRASATLQGHHNILELLDGKRGPRSFPRVIVKLRIAAGNEKDLRREVRTVVSSVLKSHGVQFSDVAVPEIADAEDGSKGKIANCEIRIRYSTAVAVWWDMKLHIDDSGSAIRKHGKLQVDPAQSACSISYPVRRMTETMSVQINEAIKKYQDLNPVLRGKKDPLAQLDLDKAPSIFVQTVIDSVQEMQLRYEEVTKHLHGSNANGMAKLREITSEGRYFVEAPQEPKVNEEDEDEEDPEDGIYPELAEQEEEMKKMLSQLLPLEEARAKNLMKDVVEHYQTTDAQKRYVVQFEKMKALRKGDAVHVKDIDAPTATLLAPTYAGPEKKPVKEEVDDSLPQETTSTNNTIAAVRKGATLAQKKLKTVLVPGSEWAAANLNDTNAVPHGDSQREIYDQGLVLGGRCVDPGIKEKSSIDKKAKAYNPEDPNYLGITDVCRLGITFSTVDALLACVEALRTKAEVCWIDNKFHTPSMLGYQEINMGINSKLPGEKSFFCEVSLSLDQIHDAKTKNMKSLYEKMYSCLAELHIPAEMHDSFVRTMMIEFEHVECPYDDL